MTDHINQLLTQFDKRTMVSDSAPIQLTSNLDKSLLIDAKPSVQLLRAADVTMRPTTWLWDQWLLKGKLTILAGSGGTGKTTLTLGLASVITAGGRLPSGLMCNAIGNVLIWSGEDDPEDVLVPRLKAMGANLERIHFISAIGHGNQRRAFDPSSDIGALDQSVKAIGGVSLLIIDPIVSAVAKDMNQANDVRRGLQPIVDFANQHQCGVIGISHLAKGSQGKDPTERILGSQAFSAFARMTWLTVSNKETGDRVLVRSKSNLSNIEGGFSYAIEEVSIGEGIVTSRVVWKGLVDGDAGDILKQYEHFNDSNDGSEIEEAELFLADVLAEESLPVLQLKEDSKNAGLSWATVRRASKNIGVRKIKSGMTGGWFWSLVGGSRSSQFCEDAQKIPKVLTQNYEHLQENMSTFGSIEGI